jgi:hypothetical protein
MPDFFAPFAGPLRRDGTRRASPFCALGLVCSTAVVARADDRAPAPPTAAPTAGTSAAPITLSVGRPKRAVGVAMRVAADVIVGRVGRGPELRLPAHGATSFTLRALDVGAGAILAVDTQSAEGSYTTLIGGPQTGTVLTTLRTELRGDPGERRAMRVRTGSAGTWVGEVFEGLTACDAELAILKAQRVDPASLTLLAASPSAQGSSDLAPSAVTIIEETREPTLRPLAVGSSALDAALGAPVRPSAAVDGDVHTVWTLRAEDFLQLKWPRADNSVERLELWLGAPAAATTGVWLRAAHGTGVRIDVPAGARAVAVTLPQAWNTTCIAVGNSGTRPLELAELRVFGALDRPEYVSSLASQLASDAPEAPSAAEQLAELGLRGAYAVAPRFDAMSARGRLRSVKVLGRGVGDPAVLATLLRAAHDRDENVSQAGVTALYEAGALGRSALRDLARESGAPGDRAVALLGRDAGEQSALLAALLAQGGVARPVLRHAIAGLAKRKPEGFDAALTEARDHVTTGEERVALAVAAALAGHPSTGATIAAALPEARVFEARYRLAMAAAEAGAQPEVDAWLAEQSLHAEEWMVRVAAFEALERRAPARAAELAAALAADSYPRVRARAVKTLRRGADDALLTRAAKDDDWPLVRVAGAETLAARPDLRSTLLALVDDPSRKVRAAAVRALAQQDAREAWPKIAPRLAQADEWTEVKVAGADFAAALCVAEAREPLVLMARRGLRHEATEDEQFLAARALEALNALGGEARADARRIVEREGAPDSLKKLVDAAAPSQCGAPQADPS